MADKIKTDKHNTNRHSDAGKKALKASIETHGPGRSILIGNDNQIIAGENTYKTAKKMQMPIKIVDVDGQTLIAVRRTDIAGDSDTGRALSIADNKIAKLSEFDDSALAEAIANLENYVSLGFTDLEVAGLLDTEVEVRGTSPLEAMNQKLREPDSDSSDRVDASDAGGRSDKVAAKPPETVQAHVPHISQSSGGDQTGGRAIFFGEDQLEVVEQALAYAREIQGDEASEAELLVWCLLQVDDSIG